MSLRRIAIGLLQVAVSVLLIGVAVSSIDRAALFDLLVQIPVVFVVASVLIVLCVALLQSVRWRFILSYLGGDLSRRRSAAIVFLSLLYNQVLPSTVGGDAVRIWMARQSAPSVVQVVHSVIVDRITGLAALALIATLAWPFLFGTAGSEPSVLVAGLVSFGGVGATILLFLTSFLPKSLTSGFLVNLIGSLATAVRTVSLPLRRTLRIGGLAVLGHAGVLAVAALLGWGLGIDTELSTYVIVIPPVLIVSVLPISVAGWGVREGAMVVGLGLLGVSSEEAFALSVLFGAVSTVAGLAGGGLWVLGRLAGRIRADKATEVRVQ